MILTAPRRTLSLAAVGLVVLGVAVQWAFGYRVSEGSAQVMEALALLFYAAAAVLLMAPLGRRHALMASGLAFILMAWAVHLNARLSAYLETEAGGDVIAAHRIFLATLIAGPALGLVVGIVTGLLARFERIRWTPKTTAS